MSNSFEHVARAYDLLINEERRWERERPILQHWINQATIPNSRSLHLLDLGCGTGFHARHIAKDAKDPAFAEMEFHIIGCDPSTAMLQVAADKPGGEQVLWHEGSAESPPKGTFDLVLLLGNTLSLLQDPAAMFAAVAGVMRPGGLLVMQTLNYDVLRDNGQSVVCKENDELQIKKTLTPLAAETGFGARLQIQIQVKGVNGDIECAGQDCQLREHLESQWCKSAMDIGLEIIERRTSFDLGANTAPQITDGSDKIYILQKACSKA